MMAMLQEGLSHISAPIIQTQPAKQVPQQQATSNSNKITFQLLSYSIFREGYHEGNQPLSLAKFQQLLAAFRLRIAQLLRQIFVDTFDEASNRSDRLPCDIPNALFKQIGCGDEELVFNQSDLVPKKTFGKWCCRPLY